MIAVVGGVWVNILFPGHLILQWSIRPCQESPEAKDTSAHENILQRIIRSWEVRGAPLFLMSDASSVMAMPWSLMESILLGE
jgi:hypothetical protein